MWVQVTIIVYIGDILKGIFSDSIATSFYGINQKTTKTYFKNSVDSNFLFQVMYDYVHALLHRLLN